jgi:hypothetical protein
VNVVDGSDAALRNLVRESAGYPPVATVEEQHEVLLRAANILFANEITRDSIIIPTLVFADFLDMNPQYRLIAELFVEARDNKQAWKELQATFLGAFDSIELFDIVDGIPIIRRSPIVVRAILDRSDQYAPFERDMLVKSIVIEIYERRVDPEQVAEEYRAVLQWGSLPQTSNRASVTWDHGEDYLRLLIRPGLDPDLHPILNYGDPNIFPGPDGLYKRQPPLPEPSRVGAAYKQGPAAPGRERGSNSFAPHNLIPAVVAWYVGGRYKLLKDQAVRQRTEKLVSSYLRESCGADLPIKTRSTLRRDLEKAHPQIVSVEEELSIRGMRLNTFL